MNARLGKEVLVLFFQDSGCLTPELTGYDQLTQAALSNAAVEEATLLAASDRH